MFKIVGTGLVTLLLASVTLQAQTLLLNFANPATHAVSGVYLTGTYNPARIDNGAWNTINKDTQNLVGNISVDLGQFQSGKFKMDVGMNASEIGSYNFSGLFAGTAPGHYGVYVGSAAGVAVNVSGLAAGQYQIYVGAANTNGGNPASINVSYLLNQNITFNNTNNVDPTTYSSYTTATLTNGTGVDAIASGWRQGINYVMFDNVTIGTNDNLMILTSNGTAPLNFIQIIAIPEPSTWAMLLGGAALLAVLRRRR